MTIEILAVGDSDHLLAQMDVHSAIMSRGRPGAHSEFRQPILAVVYYVSGALLMVLAGFSLVAATRYTNDSGPSLIGGISATIAAGGATLAALTAFGIGQVITYIGEIAYYTSAERNEETLIALQKIEGHLAAMRSANSGPDSALAR